MSDIRTLSLSVGKVGQDVKYNEYVAMGDHRLRVYIRSNAFPEQSCALVEAWTNGQWNELAFIVQSEMETPMKMYVWPVEMATSHSNFQKDRDRLIEMAMGVLG